MPSYEIVHIWCNTLVICAEISLKLICCELAHFIAQASDCSFSAAMTSSQRVRHQQTEYIYMYIHVLLSYSTSTIGKKLHSSFGP